MRVSKLKFYNNYSYNKNKNNDYIRQNSNLYKSGSTNTILSEHPIPISSSTDFSKMTIKKPNNKINFNNINIFNLGLNNMYYYNKKLNDNVDRNLMENIDTVTLNPKNIQSNISTNHSNINFQANHFRKLSNISNNRSNKYKLSYENQNNTPLHTCKFNLMTFRKDAFGSIIKKNGKHKISFADSPFIQKSMVKSRSCSNIKNKKTIVENSKNRNELAEVILIKRYKNSNKNNMIVGKVKVSNCGSNELVCCSNFCKIF